MHTLIVGFDAFDPSLFERMVNAGRLPHLAGLAARDGYRRFRVANPPQSEVSWTSIATGLDPGGHGIFDFVHRNPKTYSLYVSLLPTKQSPVGVQYLPPHNAHTIFDQSCQDGYPATVMWWPATFPARLESPVRSIPGLGAPDLQGKLGVGTFFALENPWAPGKHKTQFAGLTKIGDGRFRGLLPGPLRKAQSGMAPATTELQLEIDGGNGRLKLGSLNFDLQKGTWSPVVEVIFKLGILVSVRAITRFLLTEAGPTPRLYALPLQIHPLHSPWRYATPPSFVRRAWQAGGPFLTIGWPQDTTGLEEGCMDDGQFMALCESILESRRKILFDQLQDFHEGLLAAVFDSLDRVQHMFWRRRPDLVEGWYQKLDALTGEVLEWAGREAARDPRVLFVSDHGFANFEYKVHLNRWLIDGRILVLKEPGDSGNLDHVVWPASRAYAIGLNSLYLNLQGREGQGSVPPGEAEAQIETLRQALLDWRGPDGRPVFKQVLKQAEAFSGPLAANGPDLVLGFAPGFRASAQTGLGGWEREAIEPNRDHWEADHCMAAESVPGVLFSNRSLADYPAPGFPDFPALALGKALDSGRRAEPLEMSDEDQEAVAERLKGLGYL